MTISMYEASVTVFTQRLDALAKILDKAAAHAAARRIDPAALLQSRLYPDMFPLARQVQIACDAAKFGVARLAGVEAPKHADDETSFEQLRARIVATLEFIGSVPRERIDGSEAREVTIPLRGRAETLSVRGMEFLLHFAHPNFYFHMTTAYGLLRHGGVELGKLDFLGRA